MRNVRTAASAVFFSTSRLFSSSSSSASPAGELANLLLVASICKAFSRPGAAPVPVDPASISEAVVLQVLRRPSLHPSAKAHFFRWASSLPSYRPSPAAFSELLRSHCRAGLLDDLRPILRLAAASSPGGRALLEPDALKLVLDTLIRAGRVDAAIAVLDDVEALVGGGEGAAAAASVTVHPHMYNSIVLALLKKSQVGLALSTFKKLMEASADLEHLACNELLVALRRADMKDDFRKVFDVLSQRAFRFDTWGYNICIHAFGCWGELDVALKLFKEMKENGPPEAVSDICTYNSLIGALCSAGKVHNALMVYEELKVSGHEPDQFTYRTLIQGCCRVYLLDDAIRVFREMEYNNVRAETVVYNSLLHGLFKVKKVADACQLFERMVSEGVRASCYTYNILIDGLFKNGRSAAAFSLFNDLKKKGQFVDSVTYSIVVMHFCRDGQVDSALELVEEMETRGLTVDLVTVTTVLVALHKSGRWDWAERLMKHVRDSNLVPSILKWTTDMEASMRNDYQDRRKDYSPLFPAAGDFDDVISWMNPSSEIDMDDVHLDGECSDTWSSSPYMDRLADNFQTFKDLQKFSVYRGKRVQRKGIRTFDIDMVNTYLSIFLAKGKLSVACKLFEIFTEVKDPSVYTYNSLMSSFVKKGYFNVAWGVLQEMGGKLCPADIATYNVIIQGLGKMGKAELASAVLDQLMKKGDDSGQERNWNPCGGERERERGGWQGEGRMELPRRRLMGSSLYSSSFLAGACACYCRFLLIFCLLVSRGRCAVAGDGGASDQPLTPILRDLYHSSDALLEEVRALVDRHPHKFALDIMNEGDRSYSAEILVVTYNHAISDIGSNSTFRILLSFGQHGRELITSELALRLLYILSGDNTVLGMDPVSLSHILDNVVIKMVPMENINGRKLVESGELCERRNGRGVDLNRNWSVDWGEKEKDFDPYEENPGAAPFSEPEAQMMQELAKSFNPHVWVNVHSGMEALFMPYDHKNSTPDGIMSLAMKSILEEVNHHHCQDRCLVGSGGGSVGYLAHGTSTDYMYDILKVPFAFTFEIYGDAEASSKDCFKMFNPIDLTTFSKVLNDWCAAFLFIFEIGPRQLEKAQANALADSDKWISIDKNSIDDRIMGRNRRYRKMEGLELWIQELRTYFRLFMLSSVLLMFMFCSRISKSKFRQAIPSLPV